MEKQPVTVTVCRILLFLNALFWFAFAALVAAGAHPALPGNRAMQWILAGLAFGCACALVVLIALLGRRVHAAYYLTTGLLVLLMILTVTDEAGMADLIYFAAVIAPLVLLIKDRSWFLHT